MSSATRRSIPQGDIIAASLSPGYEDGVPPGYAQDRFAVNRRATTAYRPEINLQATTTAPGKPGLNTGRGNPVS